MGSTFLCFSRGRLFLGSLPRRCVWDGVSGARRASGSSSQTLDRHPRPTPGTPPPRSQQWLPVQSRQQHRTKPDPPALLVLLQTDRLARQYFTKKNRPVAPMKVAVLVNPPPLVAGRILHLRQPRRIHSLRGHIHARRRRHPQRLVRSLLVVVALEASERPLLSPRRRFRRLGGLLFQGAMHSLVPPVLLRVARLDALRHDAQSQEPHAQPAQPAHRQP